MPEIRKNELGDPYVELGSGSTDTTIRLTDLVNFEHAEFGGLANSMRVVLVSREGLRAWVIILYHCEILGGVH